MHIKSEYNIRLVLRAYSAYSIISILCQNNANFAKLLICPLQNLHVAVLLDNQIEEIFQEEPKVVNSRRKGVIQFLFSHALIKINTFEHYFLFPVVKTVRVFHRIYIE